VLFGQFAIGEGVMRVRSRLNRSGTRADRWSQVIVVIGVVGGILAGLGFATWHATAITGGEWQLFVVGLILMATGVLVRQWAIFTLGTFFTDDIRVHAQQPVIDTGPYRWVHHPSYSGLIIFFIGFGLAMTNWMSLLVLAMAPTAALVARILTEEHALLAGMGEPYRRYAGPARACSPSCGDPPGMECT
jgi:protein-S-isoprenylcysteine O-methyltransferase Ste14